MLKFMSSEFIEFDRQHHFQPGDRSFRCNVLTGSLKPAIVTLRAWWGNFPPLVSVWAHPTLLDTASGTARVVAMALYFAEPLPVTVRRMQCSIVQEEGEGFLTVWEGMNADELHAILGGDISRFFADRSELDVDADLTNWVVPGP